MNFWVPDMTPCTVVNRSVKTRDLNASHPRCFIRCPTIDGDEVCWRCCWRADRIILFDRVQLDTGASSPFSILA